MASAQLPVECGLLQSHPGGKKQLVPANRSSKPVKLLRTTLTLARVGGVDRSVEWPVVASLTFLAVDALSVVLEERSKTVVNFEGVC